jgi:ADP-ribose pyrophosphatase
MITIKNKEIICKGKFSSYQITHFLDRNEKERGWEWFSKKDVVVILPVTKENKIVCIRNYRIPIESNIIELPAGLMDTNASPEEQIRKELSEETGYVCEKIYQIGRFPLNAGITNNFVTYYVGINAELSDIKQNLEESEDIDVRVLSPHELTDLLKDKNVVVDSGIFSLIYLAQINGYLER